MTQIKHFQFRVSVIENYLEYAICNLEFLIVLLPFSALLPGESSPM